MSSCFLLQPHPASTALKHSTRYLISSNSGSRPGAQQLPGRRPSIFTSAAHGSATDEPNNTNSSSSSSSSNDSSSSSSSHTSSTRRRRRPILFSRSGSSSRSRGAKPPPAAPAAPPSSAAVAAAAELFGDASPDSPGSQERALLMAYLESLDSDTAAAFTALMQQQLEETAKLADDRAAAEAAQALLDAALASDDPTAFLKARRGTDLVMDTVRSQFSPDEAALLDSFLGPDWAAAAGRPLEPGMLQRLASLAPEQQLLLANILSKAEGLNKQAESLQQRTQQEGADSSAETTSTTSSSRGQTSSSSSRSHASGDASSGNASSRSWGSSFSRSKGARAARARQQEATDHWDRLLDGEMSGRLQKMVALAGQAAKGKLQFGRPPNKHLQELKRLTNEMLTIETQASNGAVSPQAFRAFIAARDARLNAMLEDPEELSAACQSVLIFMELLFNPFADDSATGRPPGSAAAAAEEAADATGEQEQRQVRRWQDLPSLGDQRQQLQWLAEVQQRRPVVSLQRIAQLRRFVRAAANLEAFQAWAEAFATNHPGLVATPAGGTLLSGLEGDLWFVAPQSQAEARAATEAAIEQVDKLAERLAAQQQQEGSSSSGGGGGGLSEADMLLAVAARASAVSETLLPHVDEERVAAVAALDADVLWFLAELEASSYDEEVLLKWSLHSSIGPALQHGRLLSELQMPEELRRLYQAAQVPEFMPSINFDIAKMKV